jgi:hypothetical protein
MLVIWGTRHFGACDRIEGLGEVQTRFFHIWFVPLIPLGSTFVTHEDGNHIHGFPVGFSVKSILLAWGRTAAVLTSLGMVAMSGSGLLMLVNLARQHQRLPRSWTTQALTGGGMAGGGLCMLVFCALLYLSLGWLFGKARGSRKAELLARAGAPAEAGLEEGPEL